jgi:hypothetical protein
MSLLARFFGAYRPADGGQLRTLREAGGYITKLPKKEQAEKRW